MKLKFKIQAYQTQAVNAVVECFAGQPFQDRISYLIDKGRDKQQSLELNQDGFRNADLILSEQQVLNNIREIQGRQNLPMADELVKDKIALINLTVEMETGTGKTYCYIKTLFELNKRYGWSKFIIVVPSVAIREGVYKSLQITADHFLESYGKKVRFFIYNSSRLHQIENYSSEAGINVMVINMQAFNATGKDNRKIYEELDDFQSRKPIDVISANRPIIILDEPQKMMGSSTLKSLEKFKPLMVLRYSATHKKDYNKVYRLDALDAYNQKLVKKISPRGVEVKGLAGTSAYLYLEAIEISTQSPVARVEMEIKQKNGIKRITKKLSKGDNLYDLSNGLDQYKGFIVNNVNYNTDIVDFTNGHILSAGQATGDITEETIRRIQIRETIRAHLEKERSLYGQGIKVLSLFFIDEVIKYRDYSQTDEKGDYARVFEEEYQQLKDEFLSELTLDTEAYKNYLENTRPEKTHQGYFAIDKKSKRLINPNMVKRGEEKGLSDDVDAYDLILKDKERLLSLDEPVRFIFSHSALREGWDNPNVFVICMLKHPETGNVISRRQEVGRGLRLAVNQDGERQDHPATVHDINVLTVVANESYKDFVTNLQKEIGDSLSDRPKKANEAYFLNKVIETPQGEQPIDNTMARQIYKYLLKNDYIGDDDTITPKYHEDKASGNLAVMPEDLLVYQEQLFSLIDAVYSQKSLPNLEDGRKTKVNPLNANFHKKEFQALWQKINHKAVYKVAFDSNELIHKAINALDKELNVTKLKYYLQSGIQKDLLTDTELKEGKSFDQTLTSMEMYDASVYSKVKYDLVGKLGEATQLKRTTIVTVLTGIQKVTFEQFKHNPEHFITEVARIINEQKATTIIEHLSYDLTEQKYNTDIFTASQTKQDFSQATEKLKHHIYDYLVSQSNIERAFAKELDMSNEVAVYAKLPNGFAIPTPLGDYNPDWAIAFKEGTVKHIFFIAETKGSMSSMQLNTVEEIKVNCAYRFFERLNTQIDSEKVKYHVVKTYENLIDLVIN